MGDPYCRISCMMPMALRSCARQGIRWTPPLLIGIALSAIAWRPDSAGHAWASLISRTPCAGRAVAHADRPSVFGIAYGNCMQ